MFEIELSLKIVSLPSQVVSVPFPTGGGWREGIFIQPHNLHKTQPAAQNKLLSTPRGSHPKRDWSIGILSQPRGGPDRKNGQNKSGLVTVQKCEESSRFLGDGTSLINAMRLLNSPKIKRQAKT